MIRSRTRGKLRPNKQLEAGWHIGQHQTEYSTKKKAEGKIEKENLTSLREEAEPTGLDDGHRHGTFNGAGLF